MITAIVVIATVGIIIKIKPAENTGNSSITAAPTIAFVQHHHSDNS